MNFNILGKIREKLAYREIDNLIYSPALKKAYSSCSLSGGTLTGRTVAVTGVTGGIGRATAERFIKEGCHVILIGRDEVRLREIKNEIGNTDTQYAVIDLSKAECFESTVLSLMAENRIDIWVNCAGIFTEADRKRRIEEITRDQFLNMYNINYRSTILLTEIVAKEMKARSIRGKIINVASMVAYDKAFYHTTYGVSKSALVSRTRKIAEEYKNDLSIMGIAPGSTVSRMSRLEVGCNISDSSGGLERFLIPEEVAATIAFMTSSVGQYLNENIVKIYPYNLS